MSRITFENYSRRVQANLSDAEIAGRYVSQADAEAKIAPDVKDKLALTAHDHLLEIGCGVGTLLTALRPMVDRATGIDHPIVIRGLAARYPEANIEPISGNFLDIAFPTDATYSKILVYSVLHCLSDRNEALAFIDKALALLAPGGRLLLGDIPNMDRKKRFQASPAGQAFERAWKKVQTAATATVVGLDDDPELLTPDDDFVLEVLARSRRAGFDAYLLPQPVDLPFGHTREDIVIARAG